MMNKIRSILFIIIIFFFGFESYAQLTYPVPYDLSNGTYSLMGWDSLPSINPSGAYPPNMIFHQTKKVDAGINDEPDSDWHCAYNLTTKSRINGLNDNGISFYNTGQVQDSTDCDNAGFVGEALLALRTINVKYIFVYWLGGFLDITGKSDRLYCIRLQYRVGSSGDFKNLLNDNGDTVEYNYSGYINATNPKAHDTLFSSVLPSEVNNQNLVQLRWKYYFKSKGTIGGSRPKLRIDDIVVKGEIINDVPDNTDIQIISYDYNNKIIIKSVACYGLPLIKIYNINGLEIKSGFNFQTINNELIIDFNNMKLSAGLYFIMIESNNKFILKKLLIN